MPSPAVQVNFADAGGVSPGTCTIVGAQTAGNTNAICLRGDPFSGTPSTTDITSVTDSAGNTYTKRGFATPPAFGLPAVWIYTCEGIAAHAAGSVISVAFTGTFFLQITHAEYHATGAFRAANFADPPGGSNIPVATTLTGTVVGDLVVMTSWANAVSVSAAGNVGANAANIVKYDNGGGHNFATQDGVSDGSSPMTVVCGGGVTDNLFSLVAVTWAQAGGGGGLGPFVETPQYRRAPGNKLYSMASPQVVLPPLTPPVPRISDWTPLRAAAPSSRVQVPVQLPAISATAAPVNFSGDVAARRMPTTRVAPAQDQALPRLGSSWAPDAPFARVPPPTPLRAWQDTTVPAIRVLPTWAAEGSPARPSPSPARPMQEVQLPAIQVLPTWAPDDIPSRQLPRPSRLVQDTQLPPVEVLSTWVAESSAARPAATATARVAQDVQLPGLSAPTSLAWVADGNAARSLPPSSRLAPPDVQLPTLRALPAWAPETPTTRQLTGPARGARDAVLPGFAPPLLLSWVADSVRPQAPSVPQRVPDAIPQPKTNALLAWAPDAPVSLPQVAPLRASVDATLAGFSKLAPPPTDAGYLRPQPAPLRISSDQVLFAPPAAKPVVDWYYARPRNGSIAMAPLFDSAVLPNLQRSVWVPDWQFQRPLPGPQAAIQPALILVPLFTTASSPGCAHGTVTAIYSASGSMFLTASASGLISPLASATSKITRCT